MNILQVPLSSNSLASIKENEFKSCIPLYYSEDHSTISNWKFVVALSLCQESEDFFIPGVGGSQGLVTSN